MAQGSAGIRRLNDHQLKAVPSEAEMIVRTAAQKRVSRTGPRQPWTWNWCTLSREVDGGIVFGVVRIKALERSAISEKQLVIRFLNQCGRTAGVESRDFVRNP